jgi:hypothetical protein
MINKYTSSMKQIFFFFLFGMISNSYSQEEFKDKFQSGSSQKTRKN